MLAKVLSCAVVGLEGAIVEVEVDILPGEVYRRQVTPLNLKGLLRNKEVAHRYECQA